mmetsp:Transcript_31403/g.100216  ORF Transcript_31403/g.100216 Transcript_31403/m.100216 type:complete len:128 (-) Transcript_31403:254-637(-)
MSSSCVPVSATLPWFITTMRSAFLTVERRCAMTSTVLSATAMARSSASCTKCSLSASRAEVASSRMSTRGFRTSALAMATRCRCPPESVESPTWRWYPPSIPSMNWCALASLAAATTSSSGTSRSIP